MGNLTRDPELRYTQGGAAVCALGLAMNRRFTTARGEDKDETCFVDIDVWGKQAESCHNYLRKGAPVFVEGRLRFDQWEDRETGRKRSRLTVTAINVQFLGSPSRGGGSNDVPEEYRADSFSGAKPAPTDSAVSAKGENPVKPPPFPPVPTSPTSTGDVKTAEDESLDDIPF